jgi:2-dehydropantoate 2-reductase
MTFGVVGAGAIGGYLAAALSAGGCPVVLYSRHERSQPPCIIRLDGSIQRGDAPITLTTDPRALSAVSLCIVAVKSTATADVAAVLDEALLPDAPVVSFQNGLDNVSTLARRLGERVFGGVVTFHVIRQGHYRRRASKGKLVAGGVDQVRVRAMRRFLERAGERLELARDMGPVFAGKLLLNLNNGVCAATGLGIRDVMLDRSCRRVLAQCIEEGLTAMRAAGIEPARVSALPPSLLARALRLPDFVVARPSLAITRMAPDARSSTLDDLDAGRRTEIDALNGAIVDLAQRHGLDAPANRTLVAIVHDHEAAVTAGRAPRYLSPEELERRLQLAEDAPSLHDLHVSRGPG